MHIQWVSKAPCEGGALGEGMSGRRATGNRWKCLCAFIAAWSAGEVMECTARRTHAEQQWAPGI
eukprot:3205953-Alexandrium_andersonii.AAC.1